MNNKEKAKCRFIQGGEVTIVFKPQCLGCNYNKTAYDCGLLGKKEEAIMKNLKKCDLRTEMS